MTIQATKKDPYGLASLRISDFIDARLIRAQYQPIVSLKKQTTIGFEATCHALHPHTGESVPISYLYKMADHEVCFVEFDRHCRQVALEALSVLHKLNPTLQLFLRFDSSVLNHGVVGSQYLLDQVRSQNISSESVVVEIVESSVRDDRALTKFVREYQKNNFLISLSGLGKDQLNLHRIPLVKPNIVHIGGPLIADMVNNPLNQVVVKSVVQLANNMGAMVVANGIDSIESGVLAGELGIDLQQGELFGGPQALLRENLMLCQQRIRQIVQEYRNQLIERIKVSREKRSALTSTISNIAGELNRQVSKDFPAILEMAVKENRSLECLYVLDKTGIQVGDTVCGKNIVVSATSMFQPAKAFTDHSLKDYYYRRLDSDSDLFVSEPYVSLASGNTCITLSLAFNDAENYNFILCGDFVV
ncbi:MAG: EAL domain-containing protein [bacterium]